MVSADFTKLGWGGTKDKKEKEVCLPLCALPRPNVKSHAHRLSYAPGVLSPYYPKALPAALYIGGEPVRQLHVHFHPFPRFLEIPRGPLGCDIAIGSVNSFYAYPTNQQALVREY